MGMHRSDRELLTSHTELWDFLGRDELGTRITGILIRKREATTVEELRHTASLPGYLEDIPGIGPSSVERIRERLGLDKAKQ